MQDKSILGLHEVLSHYFQAYFCLCLNPEILYR